MRSPIFTNLFVALLVHIVFDHHTYWTLHTLLSVISKCITNACPSVQTRRATLCVAVEHWRSFWTLMLQRFKHPSKITEETVKNFSGLQWQPFPQLVDLHCCHHCKWTRAEQCRPSQYKQEVNIQWQQGGTVPSAAVESPPSMSPLLPPLSLPWQTHCCRLFVPLCPCMFASVFFLFKKCIFLIDWN